MFIERVCRNGCCCKRQRWRQLVLKRKKVKAQISLELVCGAYGTRNRLPLCLQRTLTPGHGESIYKKRRNLAVSSCGAYGTRTRDPLRDRQIF